MESFASYLHRFKVPEGKIGVFWLGQAGFAFKGPKGTVIAVDPYFSDCCNRYFGFRRLISYIMTPYDIQFDAIVCSHAHYDHFDVDALPQALSNGTTRLICAVDCLVECERLNIHDNITTLKVGDSTTCGEFTITGLPCDHGDLAPDALGLMIECDGQKIYIMGDTCFRADLLENPALHNTDLLILPINGAFGNLNAKEGAKVCSILKPKLAIPCHCGAFAEHGGDPGLYAETMKNEVPEVPYRLMRAGEGILL